MIFFLGSVLTHSENVFIEQLVQESDNIQITRRLPLQRLMILSFHLNIVAYWQHSLQGQVSSQETIIYFKFHLTNVWFFPWKYFLTQFLSFNDNI